MKFDFIAFLGGLTAGAAGAALFAVGSKQLGWSGGPGGFGGGSYAPGGFGPGVVSGPPSGGGSGPMGPLVPQDQEMVFKKTGTSDEETFVCRRKYPVQPVAWGPPAVWL